MRSLLNEDVDFEKLHSARSFYSVDVISPLATELGVDLILIKVPSITLVVIKFIAGFY